MSNNNSEVGGTTGETTGNDQPPKPETKPKRAEKYKPRSEAALRSVSLNVECYELFMNIFNRVNTIPKARIPRAAILEAALKKLSDSDIAAIQEPYILPEHRFEMARETYNAEHPNEPLDRQAWFARMNKLLDGLEGKAKNGRTNKTKTE